MIIKVFQKFCKIQTVKLAKYGYIKEVILQQIREILAAK